MPSWPWSYGSWIYNYLWNQCLLPLKLWVQTPFRWGVLDTTLCDNVRQWLATILYSSLFIYLNQIGGVMVNVLTSGAVDRGFKPWSGQTKDFKISMCCFSANDTPLGRKSKDWFARYQDNVSGWSDMFIAGLDNNVCPRQVETSVGQVKFVGHLSVGTSKKKTHTEMP